MSKEEVSCENAFGIFLALIASGLYKTQTIKEIAEKAFALNKTFNDVKEVHIEKCN